MNPLKSNEILTESLSLLPFKPRMAKLYELYMLVGEAGYRNTLVHVAAGVISAHATNFSAQASLETHLKQP